MPPPLLSRTLDPLLGVFTGAFAYYLWEANPRNDIKPDEKLDALVKWKWSQWQEQRARKLSDDEDIDWKAIVAENPKA